MIETTKKTLEAFVGGNHNMNQKFNDKPNPPVNLGTYNQGVMAERQRIVNLLMIQHEAAKHSHNYWHVAAMLVQADVASDT